MLYGSKELCAVNSKHNIDIKVRCLASDRRTKHDDLFMFGLLLL